MALWTAFAAPMIRYVRSFLVASSTSGDIISPPENRRFTNETSSTLPRGLGLPYRGHVPPSQRLDPPHDCRELLMD
jgi:hypothetical protein